jgi:hypothetical protein
MAVPASQLLTEMARRLKSLAPSAPPNNRTILPFWNGTSWVILDGSKAVLLPENQFETALERLYGFKEAV